MARLSEIFDLQMGKTPARANSDYWVGGTNSWVSIADLSSYEKYVGKTKEKITDSAVQESGIKAVPPNTVIMSFKLSLGKTAITQGPIYTNEAIMAFIPKSTYEILPDYLFYLLSSRDWSKGTNRAVMGVTLNKATIGEINIEIPPFNEQRQVAMVLDQLNDLISFRKQQLAKLDELVKARFVEMFSACEQKDILGNVVSISRGASPRPISEYITNAINGVNWIKIGDVPENSLYIDHTKEKITLEGAKKSRYVCKGDFILSNSMSFGRPYILNINGCVHDGWLIISDYCDTFQPLYLYYAIRDSEVQNQFSGKVNGATVKNLNSDLVKSTLIKIPPMELQQQFSGLAIKVEQVKLTIQQSLDKLEVLKKSLMQEYLG